MKHLALNSDTLAEVHCKELQVYLAAAAKIVETVAFEAALKSSSARVQELLALACAIERAADGIVEQV